jgi:hypothetical protein
MVGTNREVSGKDKNYIVSILKVKCIRKKMGMLLHVLSLVELVWPSFGLVFSNKIVSKVGNSNVMVRTRLVLC